MKQIINSFKGSNSTIYYRLWNTSTDLPETLPMNFLTFLQYNGLENKPFLFNLHKVIINLTKNMTNSYPYPNEQDFADIQIAYPRAFKEMDEKSDDLEKLFIENRNFEIFYLKFSAAIQEINPHPNYPRHYYLSWHSRFVELNKLSNSNSNLIEEYFPKKENTSESYEEKLFGTGNIAFDVRSWYHEARYINDRTTILNFYLALAENNYILINSIPHIFRDDHRVVLLFKSYGMENSLPKYFDCEGSYNAFEIPKIEKIHLFGLKQIRQYLNYVFNEEESNQAIKLHELSEENILEYFQNSLKNKTEFIQLVNFIDQYGNLLYPFQFYEAEQFNEDIPYVFWNQLHKSKYAVFLKNGILIDCDHYKSIKIVEPNSYDGILKYYPFDYESFRCHYDFSKKEFVKAKILENGPPEMLVEGNPVIKIREQVWMVKNLDVVNFRNGDIIPNITTPEEWKEYDEQEKAAWCYYDNNKSLGRKNGKLYNWYAVNDPRGLAPEGWRIPKDDDWYRLIDALGGLKVAGKKLKFNDLWIADKSGTNESGFSAIPMCEDREYGYWWSATEIKDYSRIIEIDYSDVVGFRTLYHRAIEASVRCIKE
jgi:uncharacterized protein (TIGR02145 family)